MSSRPLSACPRSSASPACSRRSWCAAAWPIRGPRAFLEAADEHPLDAFGGLREAAEWILRHVRAACRITVHGDYDVDGVTASAVLIRALRTVGADVDWYLPSRSTDGYGLAAATVDRLAERGTDLLVTVDCAITAVDEVARAREGAWT